MLTKKQQVSKLYEDNFKILMKEAQECSCWTSRGKFGKCSNPKHQEAVKNERRLLSMSIKAS